MKIPVVQRLIVLLSLTLVAAASLQAQNLRGSTNGSVAEPSGAVVPVAIEAVNNGTGVSWKAIACIAGEIAFHYLPLGTYTVTVSAGGYKPDTIANVPVSARAIYTLPVNVSVNSESQTIQVSARARSLDMTSAVHTAQTRSPNCPHRRCHAVQLHQAGNENAEAQWPHFPSVAPSWPPAEPTMASEPVNLNIPIWC